MLVSSKYYWQAWGLPLANSQPKQSGIYYVSIEWKPHTSGQMNFEYIVLGNSENNMYDLDSKKMD